MTLGALRDHIAGFDKKHIFNYGLSDPFHWSADLSTVAFSVKPGASTRMEVLGKLEKAYAMSFSDLHANYPFDDYTPVQFEHNEYEYTDGEYCEKVLAAANDGWIELVEDRVVSAIFV